METTPPNTDPNQRLKDGVHKTMQNDLKAKVRQEYNRKNRRIINWMQSHGFEDQVRDGELNLETFEIDKFLMLLQDLRENGSGISVLEQFRASLKNTFRDAGVPFNESDNVKLLTFFTGMKKEEAEKIQSGQARKREGRAPLSFELYKAISMTFMTTPDPFAHLYLLLCWNLMTRTESVARMCVSHMELIHDAIGVRLPRQKNDQTGERVKDPRHMYANPMNPCICPILSLGIYFLSNINITNRLFAGGNFQADRFGENLKAVLQGTLRTEEGGSTRVEQFVSAKDIGSHSMRKGSVTYVTGSSTGSPCSVAVRLRAGWHMGKVEAAYFKYEAAADQYVGRCAAGLPCMRKEFSVLPPHFSSALGWEKLKEILDLTVPQAESRVEGITSLLLRCIASVIYHRDWLKSHLPPDHALFQNGLFRNRLDETLKDYVLCGMDSPSLHATGITPHSSILQTMEVHHQKTDQNFKELPDVLDKLLEKRDIGSGNLTYNHLKSLMKECLLELNVVSTSQNQNRGESSGVGIAAECIEGEETVLRPHYSDGRFYRAPPDYSFPSVVPKTGWLLWWNGDKSKRLPPIRKLRSEDFKIKNTKKRFSEWKLLFSYIENLCKEADQDTYIKLHDMSMIERVTSLGNLFDRIEPRIMIDSQFSPSGRCRRPSQDKVKTVYKRLQSCGMLKL